MILFVCSQAFIRSRTAEILATMGGALDVRSAGTDKNVMFPINEEMLDNAKTIYCMEQKHKEAIIKRCPWLKGSSKIITFNIPDHYERFNTDLVERLISSVNNFDEGLASEIKRGADKLYAAHPELKKHSDFSESTGFRGAIW